MPKTQPYCKECGSADVTMDTLARWDMDSQKWVVSAELDNTDCEQCGGECGIKWSDGRPLES